MRPKIPSFIDYFHELNCTFAFISETWFSDGSRLELETENLLLGCGLSLFARNRPVGNAGFSHGGVAIVALDSASKLKPYDFPNPDNFEVLAVVGKLAGVERPIALIVVYVPPNYDVPRGKACLDYVCDLVQDIKRKFRDTLICIGGDFNQWKIEDALLDFPEIAEVITPPTRKDRRIDRVFCNWHENVVDVACLAPLDAENAAGDRVASSDHKVQFVASWLEKKPAVEWEKFTFRPYNEKSAKAFIAEMKNRAWHDVFEAEGSNDKAAVLQSTLDNMMDRFFPLKTVKRRTDDLPWFNETAKKKVEKKKAVFKAESRSARWKALRDDLDSYLEKRKEIFLQKQRENMTGPDASRHFYKNVKSYKSYDRPKSFDVRDLHPGLEDRVVADQVAEYFNQISQEFEPLRPEDVPETYHRPIPLLSPSEVELMLKKSKKTMIKGDIFPKLVVPCSAALSIPLACIYNSILTNYDWPDEWKKEYVTTIPKKKLPSDLSDLRNISCTLLFSKVFEAYVLKSAMEEISLKGNQFGGVKGCSTAHMLVDIVQEICTNAEDYRSATVITAIDYSKAFNRVSFQHCLAAFAKKNASTPIIRLMATFLSNRTMTVRVGEAWSQPRAVSGGCPQGSILGVFLFNVTTEDLEEDFEEYERNRLGLRPAPGEPLAPMAVQQAAAEPEGPLSPAGGGVFRMAGARRVCFLQNVRNIPFINPPLETKVGTQVLTLKPVKIFKYVDDNVSVEKLNFGNEPVMLDALLGLIKKKQAISSQNAFASITTAAMRKGMVVNESKTNLLCVSDSLNFKTLAYIKDSNDNQIECSESMRVLGFYLSNKTGVGLHVSEISKKVRQKFWVLYHLRKLGFTEDELVSVYRSVVLPIFDYCCPVYHSLLSDLQDQALERAQVGALRCIFGYSLSARKLREKAGLQTLRARRINLTDKFAQKCVASDRFKHWFPLKEGRISARSSGLYREDFAKCNRLKNSPVFYMRRRLNGKDGKLYGQRNKEYRE